MHSRLFVRLAATLTPFLLGIGAAHPIDWTDPGAIAQAAVQAHPSFLRLEAETRAAQERVTQAGSWPNPMLMGGVENQQIDLRNDEMMTMYRLGASQTIPRRSKRIALRTSAQLAVRRLELEAASLRAEIERDALFAWYEIAAADSQVEATRQVGAMIDVIIAAVRVRYEVGTAMQADVINAQLQRTDIEHQILRLTGQRRIAVARLLPLLGLSPATPVPALHLPHTTALRSVDGDISIADSHPALGALGADVEQREEEIKLARLITRPDWNLEASYGLRTEQTDMFSVLARIELPLRRREVVEPRIREAAAERDVAARRVEELRRTILQDLGVAEAVHDEASKQLTLHEQVLVPQAKLAFESTLAAYQSDKASFQTLLSAESTYLRLEVDYYDFLLQHIKAATDFDALQKGARRGAIGGMGAVNASPRNPTMTTEGMS